MIFASSISRLTGAEFRSAGGNTCGYCSCVGNAAPMKRMMKKRSHRLNLQLSRIILQEKPAQLTAVGELKHFTANCRGLPPTELAPGAHPFAPLFQEKTEKFRVTEQTSKQRLEKNSNHTTSELIVVTGKLR